MPSSVRPHPMPNGLADSPPETGCTPLRAVRAGIAGAISGMSHHAPRQTVLPKCMDTCLGHLRTSEASAAFRGAIAPPPSLLDGLATAQREDPAASLLPHLRQDRARNERGP